MAIPAWSNGDDTRLMLPIFPSPGNHAIDHKSQSSAGGVAPPLLGSSSSDALPASHLCKLINFKVQVALISQVPAGPTGILRFTLIEPVSSPRDWRKAFKR